jgi:hypothetical protein
MIGMISISNSKALIEWHPQHVPLEIQEVLRILSPIFQIVTPKVAETEVLGGIDR